MLASPREVIQSLPLTQRPICQGEIEMSNHNRPAYVLMFHPVQVTWLCLIAFCILASCHPAPNIPTPERLTFVANQGDHLAIYETSHDGTGSSLLRDNFSQVQGMAWSKDNSSL